MNQDVANQIIRNFNRIWNSMHEEYEAYFSQKDIDNIARCDDTKLEPLKDEDKSNKQLSFFNNLLQSKRKSNNSSF